MIGAANHDRPLLILALCPQYPGENVMMGNFIVRRASSIGLVVLIVTRAGGVLTAGEAAAPAATVLVVYYSLTGTTEKMAQGVADGSRQVAGTAVVVKRVEEGKKEDLE